MAVSFRVNTEYARIDKVIDNLYICGVTALNPSTMEKYGITYIINATNEVPNIRSLSHIARHKLWLDDTPQTYIYDHLEEQSNQIASLISEGHTVLLHCIAGVSRSSSLILAYLTRYYCKSLRDAFYLLSSIRPLVRPNIGFWRQLISFEENLKCRPSSIRLVYDENQEENIIPDVYLRDVHDEMSPNCLTRRSSNGKSKFRPVLPTLPEIVDATA